MGLQIRQKLSSLGPIFACQTPQFRQAPSQRGLRAGQLRAFHPKILAISSLGAGLVSGQADNCVRKLSGMLG